MIHIDFSTLIFFYLCCMMLAVFPFWLKLNNKRRPEIRNTGLQRASKSMMTCELCLHDYVDSRGGNSSTCPQCGHANEINERDET